MKVKCIFNTGKALLDYERIPLGTTDITQYGQLEIGKEYLVMGMIMTDGYLTYLVDDDVINACPYQFFEITDSQLTPNWYFKALTKQDKNYPNQEAVWGYYELCFNDNHYAQLVDMEESAMRIYFKRKIETEKIFADNALMQGIV